MMTTKPPPPSPEASNLLNLEEKPLKEQIEEEIRTGRAAPQVMPQIGARVREVTCREDYAMSELTSVIECEPALAARILRYANSAAYTGLTEITDLHQAITRLGARMVESIAVAAATKELYQANSKAEARAMESLWKHSVAAGEAGRLIAREIRFPHPEEAFLTCLLHDVGWVVILRALNLIEDRRNAPIADGLREEILETLHADCGAQLLESWSVPEVIREAVRHHHRPEALPGDRLMPHIVHLADAICNKLGVSQEPDPEISLVSLASAAFLKFDDLRLATLMVDAEDAVASAARLA
jgi:HD-like signal output (HDOD) protein